MSTDTTSPTSPRVVSYADLPSLAGADLGTSAPITVTQRLIDLFADATGDHQWIHVDPQRAATGPYRGTIAHGYLTLSLVTQSFWQLLDVPDAGTIINYGLGKVRFPAPVPVGSDLTCSVRVNAVDPVPGGHQLALTATIGVAGQAKPSCIADVLFRYYAPPAER
jgi:acyl dehydratase